MQKQRGVILVITLVIMSILLSVALTFSTLILSDIKKSSAIDNSILAYYAADAGLEQSLFLMRKDSNATRVDNVGDLLSLGSNATLDNNSQWDIGSSLGSESVVYRQRLDNGKSVKLYFLDRSGAGTNNAKSITVDWEKGKGSPKLQIAFTQIDPQYEDIGIGSDALINYTDINDVIKFDTSTKCYDFGDKAADSSPFVSDYMVEIKALGTADEYVDNLTVKSYGVSCGSIVPGETEVDGEAITNLTIRSKGTYNGTYQEIVAHLPPKDLASGIADFVLFSDEDITKDTNTRGYVQPSCFDVGANPIPICTCDDLDNVRNYLDRDFALQNDIDFNACDARYTTGAGWEPIDNFRGKFDGQNHKIGNLYINRSVTYAGLFGGVYGASISDIGLLNVNVTGNDHAGGLVGYSFESDIYNVYLSGDVSGVSGVGGLAGAVNNGQEINKDVYSIYSSINVHGIGTGYNVGGLIGTSNGYNIYSSYSSGTVSGSQNVGGLIGSTNQTNIYSSYSSGNVLANAGGLLIGGLVGSHYGEINNSYSSGSVIGGEGSYLIGGLVGQLQGLGASINNSYSVGTVSGGHALGGLIASNSGGTIDNSYWNIDIYSEDNGVGEGKSTLEMITEATYQPEWGFVSDPGNPANNVWRINEGLEYPCLNWQAPGTCPTP